MKTIQFLLPQRKSTFQWRKLRFIKKLSSRELRSIFSLTKNSMPNSPIYLKREKNAKKVQVTRCFVYLVLRVAFIFGSKDLLFFIRMEEKKNVWPIFFQYSLGKNALLQVFLNETHDRIFTDSSSLKLFSNFYLNK